jgi:hypothetical protein
MPTKVAEGANAAAVLLLLLLLLRQNATAMTVVKASVVNFMMGTEVSGRWLLCMFTGERSGIQVTAVISLSSHRPHEQNGKLRGRLYVFLEYKYREP